MGTPWFSNYLVHGNNIKVGARRALTNLSVNEFVMDLYEEYKFQEVSYLFDDAHLFKTTISNQWCWKLLSHSMFVIVLFIFYEIAIETVNIPLYF